MRTGTAINNKFSGAELYEIDFTPNGEKEKITLLVWATNCLNASQELIIRKIWGKQHIIRIHGSNTLKNK